MELLDRKRNEMEELSKEFEVYSITYVYMGIQMLVIVEYVRGLAQGN